MAAGDSITCRRGSRDCEVGTQNTEHIVLVCYVDIMFQVSEDSKICSACRFNKCLQVGMRVELLQVITTRKKSAKRAEHSKKLILEVIPRVHLKSILDVLLRGNLRKEKKRREKFVVGQEARELGSSCAAPGGDGEQREWWRRGGGGPGRTQPRERSKRSQQTEKLLFI